MKTLDELSDTQRNALVIIDTAKVLFRRRAGWSAKTTKTVRVNTMTKLVDDGLVRIRDVQSRGITLSTATLTDNGVVLAEKHRANTGRKKKANG